MFYVDTWNRVWHASKLCSLSDNQQSNFQGIQLAVKTVELLHYFFINGHIPFLPNPDEDDIERPLAKPSPNLPSPPLIPKL